MKKFHRFFSPSNLVLITLFFAFYAFRPQGGRDLKTVSVAVDKMNVFYIGVDNPVTVAVEGVPDEKVAVRSDDVKIVKIGRGTYNVTASRPGTAKIQVHGEGFEPQELEFRVKRIPDPVTTLVLENGTMSMNGVLSAEDFKKSTSLGIDMQGFTYDYKADVKYFSIVRVPKMGNPVELSNMAANAKFDQQVRTLIDQAVPGDTYYFTLVKAQFPGDPAPRTLNSLVFTLR